MIFLNKLTYIVIYIIYSLEVHRKIEFEIFIVIITSL